MINLHNILIKIKKMKFKVASILTVITLLSSVWVAEAQVGGFLKDKAQKALVKGLKRGEDEKKIDEQQQVEEQKEKQQSKQNPADSYMQKKMMGWMGMNKVKYDPAYSYTSSMKMDVETLDSAATEVNKGSYSFYFDKNSKNFAMEFEALNPESGKNEKSLMIFDYKNMAILIISDKDGQKSGIAMAMAPDSSQESNTQDAQNEAVSQEDLSAYNMYYKPTGRTKNIMGYKCSEYVYENPEGRIELWATNDIKYDYSGAYGHMQGFQYLATGGTAYLLGTVLEMHFKDADSNARGDFWIKELNPNTSRTISVADFQIVGLGGK